MSTNNHVDTLYLGRHFCEKKFLRKKFSREEIFAKLPYFCENFLREIYEKVKIYEKLYPNILFFLIFLSKISPTIFTISRSLTIFYMGGGGKNAPLPPGFSKISKSSPGPKALAFATFIVI